jgi:hypothetical protein
MASLSNINGLFDVHSTGAILFSTSHGTSGQILRSNGNAAPTWVAASTIIGGPYLPLTGGTLSGATATASGISFTVGGALTGTSATFSGNVGIGVAAHSTYALDIQGTSGLALRFYNGTTFKSGIAAVTTAGEMIAGSVVDDFAIRANAGNMLFATNGNVERMRITDYGSLVVGNTPGTNVNWGKIQCGGTITVGNSSGTYLTHGRISGDSDGMKLKGTSTGTYSDPMGVTIDGYNVGINTNSPNVGNAFGLVIRSWATLSRLVFWNSTSGEVSSRGQRISFQNANCIFENMESGYYAFKTGGSGANPSERMRIQSDGNVGIGTDAPSKKLEVAGSYKLGTNAYIQYDAGYPYTISILNTAGVGNLIFNAGAGSSGLESKIELQGGNTTGAAGITLSTGSSTRMVVTADGKIGLGKTDPFYPVDATSFGANTHEWGSGLALFGQDRYSIRELNNLFYSADSRVGGIGTSANLSSAMFDGNFDTGHTIAANTTYVVEMDGSGTWNMTYPSGYATISFYYIYTNFTSIVGEQYHYGGTFAGQWRTMGTPVDIRGSAGSTRVVRINSAGNNYVSKWRFTFVTGSTSINVTDIAFYGTRTAGAPVSTYMRGDRTNEWTRMIRFRNNANGIVGSIAPGNTSTTFNTTSDYRLKEDLKDFAGLDMVSKIPVYDFRWINSEKRSYGVLAHELNEVYPEAVEGKKDAEENQCVDYSKIVPLLVKSIQELKAEIEILKNK